MAGPTLAELRRSYWWGSRYIESLYAGGLVHEYHTRTPFMTRLWRYPYVIWRPIGNALIYCGWKECWGIVPPWHPYSDIKQVWSYVHNTTRDYTVIARVGFENTEPDYYVISLDGQCAYNPIGDPWPSYNSDCDDPNILVEYTRNRLKNGFFTFRQYLDADVAKDLPAFWTVTPSPPPENMSVGLSTDAYQGPYSLKVWYKGATAYRYVDIYSENTEILPDTEYVLSMYYKGKINYNSVAYRIDVYDANGELSAYFYDWLDYGDYAEWRNAELRFRTPANAHTAVVKLQVWANPEPYPYPEATAYFDAFWLSECPVNLTPNYKLFAQIEEYDGQPFPDRPVDIYCYGKGWLAVSASNVPRNIIEVDVPLDGVPAFRSAIRHSIQNNVFYYKYTSMHPDWENRSNTLQEFRSMYGYTYDYYHPLWRESDTYPDNFMFSYEAIRDCISWFQEWYDTRLSPNPPNYYPYWSKVCLCRGPAITGLATKNPYFPALIAVHLMNKYRDPFLEANTVWYYRSSAYRLLFVGTFYGTPPAPAVHVPAVKDSIDPDKGWHRGSGVYSIYAAACALAAFAEIGYGFKDEMEAKGYSADAELARNYADRIAATLVKNQWGYPFHPRRTGYFRHEDFGEVNIPEAAGGFLVLTIYKDDLPYATSRKDWLTELTDLFNMPAETPGVIPVNQETTFVCMRALQIYEWYKYKGGKGAFPKLLMPADIDGDGWVSPLDVAKVKFCIDNKIYDPLCDINADGKIDEEDLNLVKAHLGRGTPRKGVIWTPTLSPTTQVGVYVRM